MSAFRDASAMAEQLARLRAENEDLRAEVVRLHDELAASVAAGGTPVNEDAFMKRLADEERELREHVAALRELVRECMADLDDLSSRESTWTGLPIGLVSAVQSRVLKRAIRFSALR